MTDPLYRATPTGTCVTADLPPFIALYDRRSGITHLLAEPAPQLLAALADTPRSLSALREHLAADSDLPDLTDDALAARLAELVDAGLIATA